MSEARTQTLYDFLAFSLYKYVCDAFVEYGR